MNNGRIVRINGKQIVLLVTVQEGTERPRTYLLKLPAKTPKDIDRAVVKIGKFTDFNVEEGKVEILE